MTSEGSCGQRRQTQALQPWGAPLRSYSKRRGRERRRQTFPEEHGAREGVSITLRQETQTRLAGASSLLRAAPKQTAVTTVEDGECRPRRGHGPRLPYSKHGAAHRPAPLPARRKESPQRLVHGCSQQCSSQRPQSGKNPKVPQLMNENTSASSVLRAGFRGTRERGTYWAS